MTQQTWQSTAAPTGAIRVRARVGSRVVAAVASSPGDDLRVIDDVRAMDPRPTGETVRWHDAELLSPVLPNTIVAFAKNYSAHAEEMGVTPPAEPVFFLKPSSAVIGPGAAIELPSASEMVHHEAELAVVIGRTARDVTREQVPDVILGFTCANDVSARDLQARDGQWGRAKGFDTFCPLGPWVVDLPGLATGATQVRVGARVNGSVRQDGSTADLSYDVAALVAWTSSVLTLSPGDVILTGTPAGVGPIEPGDEVSVSIEGIGTLTNEVTRRG